MKVKNIKEYNLFSQRVFIINIIFLFVFVLLCEYFVYNQYLFNETINKAIIRQIGFFRNTLCYPVKNFEMAVKAAEKNSLSGPSPLPPPTAYIF